MLTFMLSLIPSFSITASAASDGVSTGSEAVITVEEIWGNPGKTVDLDMVISKNPGILGATITVSWDEDLTLVADASGEAFNHMTYTSPSRYVASGTNFVWFGNEVNEAIDGTILTLTFKVAETAQNNDILPVRVSYTHGDIIDQNDNDVALSVVDGHIRAITYQPGDVTGDGRVNARDLVRLSQYISDGCKTDSEGYNAEVVEDACDVTGDGRVNARDLIKLSQYISDGSQTNPDGYNAVLKPAKMPECQHTNLQETPAKAATCTEEGNIEYWHCDECGKYFSDAKGETELTAEETVLAQTGHTYSKSWSSNESYHWHSAICGHTAILNYEKHDFDENGICSACGYTKPDKTYRDDYIKYSEIGKTLNLITASGYEVAPGAKRLFTDDLYNYRLDIYSLGKQGNEGKSYASFESYSEEAKASMDVKISFGARQNKNGIFMTNKLPSIAADVSSSYESKATKETSEYIYSWDYMLGGTRVDISEFQNREKLAGLLSPDFIGDAEKLRSGAMSAADFVKLWGTHVITSGIYGAKLNVTYYEISNHVSDYSSYKGALDIKLNARFKKTGLDVETGFDFSNIKSAAEKDTLSQLSISGTAKNTLVCSSLDELTASYKTWQNNFEKDVESNSVLVDIGDAGLCCIWYLLDDSFNDVKAMLDEYMYSQCSDLYYEYKSKLNNLKLRDDVVFDKDTGILEINLNTYQKNGNIDGFKTDNFVSYNNGVLSIKPYYNGVQVKKIVINGAYGTLDLGGQKIETVIDNVSIKLQQGDWYSGLKLKLANVAIIGADGESAIDLTALSDSIMATILFVGDNKIIGRSGADGKTALTANNIILESHDNGTVELHGGNGADATEAGGNGGAGGNAITASNIVVDMTGTLNVYGGNGGNGADGVDGGAGSTGSSLTSPGYHGKAGNGGNGTQGSNGGNGGIGGDALTANITVFQGTVVLEGGTGGSGGAGGAGGTGGTGGYTTRWGVGYGGDGGDGGAPGNGGKGGRGGLPTSKDVTNKNGHCTIIAGKGGPGGTGGKGGNGGVGGESKDQRGIGGNGGFGHCGGSGGDSGAGLILEVDTTGTYSGNIVVVDGKDGTPGKGGAGGAGGAGGKGGDKNGTSYSNEYAKNGSDGLSGGATVIRIGGIVPSPKPNPFGPITIA